MPWDLIHTHRDEYNSAEDFYRNMQRILRTDDRFILTKETTKEILERYINMDHEGSFVTMLNEVIEFFQTTCEGRIDS